MKGVLLWTLADNNTPSNGTRYAQFFTAARFMNRYRSPTEKIFTFVYTDFGNWKTEVMCPKDMFFQSIVIYYQSEKGGDDSGIVGIKPTCRSLTFRNNESPLKDLPVLGKITSQYETIGCKDNGSIITGFKSSGKLYQGCGDDVGLYAFSVSCDFNGTYTSSTADDKE